MASDFPTTQLEAANIYPEYPIEEKMIEASIKSEFEAGYVLARSKHSRNRRMFTVSYRHLDSTCKEYIETHVEEVKDIDYFIWHNPATNTNYTVRYATIPSFPYISYGRWNCSFQLEEV